VSSPGVAIALVMTLLLASMAVLSAGVRRFGVSPESVRKLLHIEMGLVTLAFPWLFSAAWPVIALACAAAAWFGLLRASIWLEARFGKALHAAGRGGWGEIWFTCGICLTFLLSAGEPVAYCIAVLVLALADAAAALVGQRFGRARCMPGGARKSAAGSCAFFVVAFAVAWIGLYAAMGLPLPHALRAALLVAAVTAALEAVFGDGLDNLFVPLGALAALEVAA